MTYAKPSFKRVLDKEVGPMIAEMRSRDSVLMYTKAVLFLGWAVIAYVGLLRSSEAVEAGFFALLLALGLNAIAFNIQHDGNHGAFSRRVWVNRLAGMSLDVLGVSSYFWKIGHNNNHHLNTNVPGKDYDIDLGRLGRLSQDHEWFWYHKYQHLYVWVLYCGIHLRYLYTDTQRILFRKRKGPKVEFPKGKDLGVMLVGKAAFICLAFVVPSRVHDWMNVCGFYIAISMCMGFVSGLVFQLAHSVDTVEHPRKGEEYSSEWVIHQFRTTSNFSTKNPLMGFFLGCLNLQGPHHLYPRVAHVHYPKLSKVIKRVCEEQGVPYHENETIFKAIASHYRFVKKMGAKPLAI